MIKATKHYYWLKKNQCHRCKNSSIHDWDHKEARLEAYTSFSAWLGFLARATVTAGWDHRLELRKGRPLKARPIYQGVNTSIGNANTNL
jgi:hypothetical protein